MFIHQDKCLSTDTATQRKFVLSILEKYHAFNTFEFRKVGICSPAPRIKELRDKGFTIDTIRIVAECEKGIKHKRVAKYVLKAVPISNQSNPIKEKAAKNLIKATS